jgi:hypothetical protein
LKELMCFEMIVYLILKEGRKEKGRKEGRKE